MKKLNNICQLLQSVYIGDTDYDWTEDLINQYIWKHKDPYLKYLNKNKISLNIFEILGIKVNIISKEIIQIIDFFDNRDRILKKDDIILQINSQNPFEYNLNSKEQIQIIAIRGLYTKSPSIIKEIYEYPRIENKSLQDITIQKTKEYAYIKFTNFNERIDFIIDTISQIYKNQIPKLIIDIRDNMGGKVKNSYKLLNIFLENNSLAYYKLSKEKKYIRIIAKNEGNVKFKQVIIIINSNTMSSAELFTASLKDNIEAVIIGEKSFGKGVMTKKFRLEDQSIVIIPKYEFFSPKLKKIHNIGIIPDIDIESSEIDYIISSKEYNKFCFK